MTSTINDKLMQVIFEVSRAMKEGMTFDSDTSQLTVLQLQTLIFINKKGSVPMGDIAGQFKISLPTATVLSDKLVNTGLLKRGRMESDRRIVNVLLTARGENILKKAMKQRHQKINKLLSYLSPEDKNKLLNILETLSLNIQKTYEK